LQGKWFITSVEVASRELTSRTILCADAIKNGWKCIISTRRSIIRNIEHIPSGVVLIKSAHNQDLEYIRLLKKHGHKIMCLDEEGLVQESFFDMIEKRTSIEGMSLVDYYFLWGGEQYNAFSQKYKSYKDKLIVVGNPRVDTWMGKYNGLYSAKVDEIQEKYGKYILIPSSFAPYNHFTGLGRSVKLWVNSGSVDRSNAMDRINYVKRHYNNYMKLIPAISSCFSDISIVMKIHPSENPDPWIKMSESVGNFHVVTTGELLEYIMGSEAVIHCGSTSSVESFLYGKPVISYCLNDEVSKHGLEIPEKVSILAKNSDHVISLLKKILKGDQELANNTDHINQYLRGLMDNYDYFSSGKIIKTLNTIDVDSSTSVDFNQIIGEEFSENFRERFVTLANPLVGLLRIGKFMPRVYKQQLRGIEYGQRKMKGLDVDTIKEKFSLISRDLEKSVEFEVSEYANDFFVIK